MDIRVAIARRMSEESQKKMLFMDGHDNAIVGVVTRYGEWDPIVCYDLKKVMKNLQDEGMTEEEAIEYFDYNIIGGWVGDRTPCFIGLKEDIIKEDGMIDEPNCSIRHCKHFIGIKSDEGDEPEENERVVCEAFPDGIPDEIAYGENLHLKKLEGQGNDIVYEEE